MLKSALGGESVKLDQLEWHPLPEGFVSGHVMWKLLHVSPEAGSWTVMFQAPKGSSFAGHIHSGPGEYFLTRGKIEVRGGEAEGGVSATGPSYGYEACNARHDETLILEDSEIYMTSRDRSNSLMTKAVRRACWAGSKLKPCGTNRPAKTECEEIL